MLAMVDETDDRQVRKRALANRRWRRWYRRHMTQKRLAKRLVKRSGQLPVIIAEIHSYDELLSAVKSRRHALHLTQEQVDEIAGFHERYTSKLEMGPGKRDPFAFQLARDAAKARRTERKARRNPHTKVGKALGDMSLPTLLQALRVKLVMVDAGEGG